MRALSFLCHPIKQVCRGQEGCLRHVGFSSGYKTLAILFYIKFNNVYATEF